MKSNVRSVRLAIVPAMVAAFALSACQDAAPTAAPPSSPAATAEQSQEEAPESSEEAPETSESSEAPEPSESSSEAAPSSDSGEAKEECESTSGFRVEREDAKPGEPGAEQSTDAENGDATVKVTPGKATVDTSAGDDYFPGEGNQTVIVPVTIEVEGDGFYVATPLAFGMSDAADEACQKDSNTVVAGADEIPIESLRDGDKVTGKVAFAMPTGADLTKYSLNFAVDYNSGDADLAWRVK